MKCEIIKRFFKPKTHYYKYDDRFFGPTYYKICNKKVYLYMVNSANRNWQETDLDMDEILYGLSSKRITKLSEKQMFMEML